MIIPKLLVNALSVSRKALPDGIVGLTTGYNVKGDFTIQTDGERAYQSNVKATDHDKWHLGSVTKSMTATLCATLVEKKVLSWTQPIGSYFDDEFTVHDDFKNVTLMDLSAHYSGLERDVTAVEIDELFNTAAQEARQVISRKYLTMPRAKNPEQFPVNDRYSNIGYMIIGRIIEKYARKSFEEYMKEALFRPLKMDSCGFGPTTLAIVNPDQPIGHYLLDEKIYTVPAEIYPDNPRAMAPAGTVHCSIKDLLKYSQIHIDGGNGIDTPVLKQNAFKILHDGFKGTDYSAGGFFSTTKNGIQRLWHDGSNTINCAILGIYPKLRLSFAAATNIGSERAAKVLFEELDLF